MSHLKDTILPSQSNCRSARLEIFRLLWKPEVNFLFKETLTELCPEHYESNKVFK